LRIGFESKKANYINAENSLGKGEVESSILSGSTRKAEQITCFSEEALPFLPVLEREQSVFPPAKLGENPGNLFGKRSAFSDAHQQKRQIATGWNARRSRVRTKRNAPSKERD
jgi:hypothetical protein